eukprot:481241-Prymnesium_polylepis.1
MHDGPPKHGTTSHLYRKSSPDTRMPAHDPIAGWYRTLGMVRCSITAKSRQSLGTAPRGTARWVSSAGNWQRSGENLACTAHQRTPAGPRAVARRTAPRAPPRFAPRSVRRRTTPARATSRGRSAGGARSVRAGARDPKQRGVVARNAPASG